MKKLLTLLALAPLTSALYAADLTSLTSPNMSKHDASSTTISANPSDLSSNTNSNVIDNTVNNKDNKDTPTNCTCAEKEKKATHIIKKHKKIVHKKLVKKAKPAKLIASDINLDKNNTITENNLSYSDVVVNVSQLPESHDYHIDMQRKDGQPLNSEDFVSVNHTKETGNTAPLFETVWLKSTLDNTQQNQLLFSEDGHYNVNVPESKNKCEAFYFTYQLKGETYPITQAIILGKKGESVAKMDTSCLPKNLNEKTTTDYTKEFYTIGLHWKKPYLSNQEQVKFSSTVTKAGIDYNPSDFQYYAISDDFTRLYHFKSAPANPSMPYYGTNFEQFIGYPGNYLFSGSFINDEGKRTYFITKKAVLNMTEQTKAEN